MKLLICFAFVALATIQCSSACTCNPVMPIEDRFCKSDLLVLVEVLNNGRVYGMNRVYKINLIATYRSNVYGRVNFRQIFTATDGAACGIILQKGNYYVLTGYYRRTGRGRQMHTGLCNVRKRFSFNPQTVYKPPNCYQNDN